MNTEPTGFQLALIGATTAADHADRVTGGSWTATAWKFLIDYGRRSGQKSFTAEDVRAAAERAQAVPTPPDDRAWGAMFLRASKARLINRIGYAPGKARHCHSGPKAVWVWVG